VPPTHEIALTLDDGAAEIQRLTAASDAFCDRHGVPEGARMALALALEELVTNVMMHGGAGALPVDVGIRMADGMIEARVEDGGAAFDPLSGADPDVEAPVEERRIGGLGVLLVKQLMDETRYERVAGRNVVTVRKRADAAK